ncbi:Hsp70 family protein (plasmid) [Chlorobium phaeovibrioides]|uniref:Hsp70 family protein n=1 Tax=Chlorobium phaeovibrioides TaxID=1094 RepID=A0A5M8I540_CHLPH|nr:Hsp70 family protein [Chlorobium phaeovibrioides]KAA6230381.1 Hsp70 family protein [Chlorobium phaeovibrioides]
MENTINFGIDLGTTNSAIAKFVKGDVVVFNNPLDYGRSTLPSVVYYKKDRIVIGNKAKEYLERDPKNVVGLFKRKMGTSESFQIKSINESKTPVELSAQVLKELKTFVNTGDSLDSVVITIPASFDSIQSNATKEAGKQAGFKQVVLLQEPIAASLAYANMKKSKEMQDGNWLVYDLGGGTFDVALVRIKEGEMKVVDHEGDNFLGGSDFDRLIVEKLIIPKISEEYTFDDLENQMKSASGKYNAKYYSLLNQAEEAKIRLSAVSSAEIIVERMDDEEGNEVDMEITITKSEFNNLIKDSIDGTIEMIKTILTRNSLKSNDIQFNLMVGGSTFIPFVRQHVEEVLQIPSNCEIDPTIAVAVGAAYYAATKQKEISKEKSEKKQSSLSIKASYNKASKEADELLAARVQGNTDGLFYKITRQDGGFDSGLKPLSERINEDLPLVENTYNFFTLTVYDSENNVVETDIEPIGINSGFGISGQPLPEDICLEVDDYDNPGYTRLALIFERNTVLPTKRTLTFPINKPILKGNESDRLWINVYEGAQTSLPEANKLIGVIEISGKQVSRDISKGSDLEITIIISESRDVTVSGYLNMSDQEFKNVFNPKERDTNISLLKGQVLDLSSKLDEEIELATEKEDFETASALSKVKKEMELVAEESEKLSNDDVTDKRYQLEDKKRKIAQEIDSATKNKRLQKATEYYHEIKAGCEELVYASGNDHERKAFNDVVNQEASFMATKSPLKIQEKSDELQAIIGQIRLRTPEFLEGMFAFLIENQAKMNDQSQAKSLIDAGKFAVESQNWDRLREINFGLFDLMPRGSKDEISTKIGFGL